MRELRIFPSGKGLSYRLWPAADDIPPGTIHENAVHVLEMSEIDDPDGVVLEIEGVAPKPLRNPSPHTARWEWAIGFHAGFVEVAGRADGQPFRTNVVLDPALRKLTRDAFEVMVFECLEDLQHVFTLSKTRLGFDRGDKRPPLARLEFLRSRLPILERAVRRILAQPHRKLDPFDSLIPIQRAKRLSGLDLAQSMRFGPHMTIDGRTLPARVICRQRRSSADTRENRSVKAFLVRWAGWLERAANSFSSASPSDDSDMTGSRKVWHRRCTIMAGRLRRLLSAPMFAEVANASEGPDGSAVFRCVAGYQQFGKIRRDLNRGLAAIAGHWLDMPIARTWELYELWVFLRFARAGLAFGGTSVKLEGVSTEGSTTTIADTSFGVVLGTGVRIIFQRKYREYWKADDGQGSFSRTMIPDVAITFGTGEIETLLVLDAKYRINEGISDALTSIHTYRDGLVETSAGGGTRGIVRGAYLVSPYIPDGFRMDWQTEDMPNRVFHPEYRQQFRFGAITMRPGETSVADAARILNTIAEQSGIEIPGSQAPKEQFTPTTAERRPHGSFRWRRRGFRRSGVPTT